MKRRIGLLALALGFASLAMGADNQGCQSESSNSVAQDRIHAAYWLFYDANSDATYARAQFRFGSEIGTTLALEAPATISFDDTELGFNELLDWHELVLPGRVDGGTFTFADADGNVFVNEAPPYVELDLEADAPATIDRSQSFEVRWEGAPVGEDELFETIVANSANPLEFIRVDQRTEGAESVVLPKSELEKLPPGASFLGIRRHRELPLDEGTEAGGKITVTFQPLDQPVTLE